MLNTFFLPAEYSQHLQENIPLSLTWWIIHKYLKNFLCVFFICSFFKGTCSGGFSTQRKCSIWKKTVLRLFNQFDFTLPYIWHYCPYLWQLCPSALHNICAANFVQHKSKSLLERYNREQKTVWNVYRQAKQYKNANLTLLKSAKQIHKRRMKAKRKLFIFSHRPKNNVLERRI